MYQTGTLTGPDGKALDVEFLELGNGGHIAVEKGSVRKALMDVSLIDAIKPQLIKLGNPKLTDLQAQAVSLGYRGPDHLSDKEYETTRKELKTIFASNLSKKEKAKALIDMDLAWITSFLALKDNEIKDLKEKVANLYSKKETKQ